MKSKFEEWFQQQHFYLNLRFIHGERLFIFDAQDGYVVQAVQISWATWQEQQKRIDSIKTKSIEQALKLSSMSERNNKQAEIIKEQRKLIDELQLKGDPEDMDTLKEDVAEKLIDLIERDELEFTVIDEDESEEDF